MTPRPCRGLRTIAALAVLCATAVTAVAEVWMIKGADAPACRDRDALVALDATTKPEGTSRALPAGCIALYSADRLLEQAQMGQGFAKYLKVERGDGSLLFVRSADVVSDPGIGSVSEDRP